MNADMDSLLKLLGQLSNYVVDGNYPKEPKY